MGKDTKLGGVLAGAAKTASERIKETATKLAAHATSRRGELVELPGLGMSWLEVIGSREGQDVDSEVIKEMRRLEIAYNQLTFDRYELERAIRTLSRAAMDPDDHAQPFGTLEQWGRIDSDRVVAAWTVYGDVRERLDPIATTITDDEANEIEIAVKKKETSRLRSYGLSKLCAWLTTTGDRLSISPTPKSPSSDGSSEPQ